MSKSFRLIFFYKKFVHLGEKAEYCCRIIVVHVHATVFSKVHSACHNIAKGIKPGSDSKRLISMLQIAQKLYVGGIK